MTQLLLGTVLIGLGWGCLAIINYRDEEYMAVSGSLLFAILTLALASSINLLNHLPIQ